MKNLKDEQHRIVEFIRKTFQDAGSSDAVIAVSGGVDSSVSLALTVSALSNEHVYPILLPCGALSMQGTLDAVMWVEKLQIPVSHVTRLDIKPVVDVIHRSDPAMDRVRKGNIMARVRMTYLFDQAKKRNGLVVGTENKTEHMLGYFTRFGDSASDIEPIVHLYKTEVYELAKELSVPQSILEKAPSAGLWPEQTDEGEFGFSYEEGDRILQLLYDEKKTMDDVIAAGFSQETVKKVKERVEKNKFKHKLPHCL